MKMMRKVKKMIAIRTMKNSSIQRLVPKTWSLRDGMSKRRALSPPILIKGIPRMKSACRASAIRREGRILLFVIFQHFIFRLFDLLMPFPGVIKGDDDAEDDDEGEAEDKICYALDVHDLFFPLIIR
jgi:hypothetical protein